MKKIFLCFFLLFLSVKFSYAEEIISKIEKNWNQINTMSGRFMQIDPDEKISTGNFYFLKPYQSKFIYDNENETVITNINLLRIIDKDGYQTNSYAIGNNVLKKILSTEFRLSEEFDIVGFETFELDYKISIEYKNDKSKTKVTIYFDKDTLDLKKWEIYDEFDNKTVLEFTNIKKNIFISQNLFAVKYRKN